jgi:lysophospholipase L1-like esterase
MTLRPVFVLFGDSITQRGLSPGGWAARLADRYSRRADVVNRGYSGYNTAFALHLLPHVFPAGGAPPALVTIFLGANDAALPARMAKRQHIPLDAYSANLRSIAAHVAHVYAAAPPAVVFITPPPVDEATRVVEGATRWGAEFDGQAERDNATAGRYAAACRAVAAELGAPCVDLWSGFQQAPDWRRTHLNDGLHFAPAGDAALADALASEIDARLPHLTVDALCYDFPDWFNVDASAPVRLTLAWCFRRACADAALAAAQEKSFVR